MSARDKYASEEAYQRSLKASRLAKQRRRGKCSECGGETRYNGRTTNGPSKICVDCLRAREHEERRWTQHTIVRSFRRFEAETGRTPKVADTGVGLCESQVLRYSGRRIAELEQVVELGLVLPVPRAVQREFGSWANGLAAAGLRPSTGGTPDHRKRFE